jgi:uncharacterized membrane protein
MEPKRSKYDTNPLDEGFPDRAGKSVGSGPDTDKVRGARTSDIGPDNGSVQAYSESEAPTRYIADKVTSYPSVFVPPKPREAPGYQPPRVSYADIYQPPPAPVYQPPKMPIGQAPGTHKVPGIGIPERWAVILPYTPFFLAIVASVIELLLVPRTESRVRFHAAQGLVLQLIITAISTLLTGAAAMSGRFTGGSLFNFATFVFLIIAIVRVWKGKTMVIPPLDEPTKWIDEKIKPRK